MAMGVEGRCQDGGGNKEGESSDSEMHFGEWAASMSEGRDSLSEVVNCGLDRRLILERTGIFRFIS